MKKKCKKIISCSVSDHADDACKSVDCTCSRGRSGSVCKILSVQLWALVPPIVAIALALGHKGGCTVRCFVIGIFSSAAAVFTQDLALRERSFFISLKAE